MEGRYCKWYCMEFVDTNKWLFESRCGEKRIVTRGTKFYKHLYKDNDMNLCPNCQKPITVGEIMD